MSAASGPDVIIIAGPNGAGKTTASEDLLKNEYSVSEFVNADWIAKGLAGFHVETAALQAGEIMLARIRELAVNRVRFAFETTLASRTFAASVKQWKEWGYRVHLIFFWVPDAGVCVQRVSVRVALGGHGIPETTIRRRYERGLVNLFGLYMPLVDAWKVFDNSVLGAPRLIAESSPSGEVQVADAEVWTELEKRYG